MTPKQFQKANEQLARLIYSRHTSPAMVKAAKDARKALHRYYEQLKASSQVVTGHKA